MKRFTKSYCYLLMALSVLSMTQLAAQETTPASATWEMTNPDAGGTGTEVATAGYIAASEETFSNTSINQYTGPEESQRVRISTNEWPANQTTPIPGVYIEYTIAPKENARLYPGNIQLGIAAMSISSMKAEIQYSKDPDFTTYSVLPYSTGLEDNYLRRDSLTRIDAELELTVLDGEAFYLRIYPWVDNDPDIRTGKYVCVKDLVISGVVESIPVEASVIWPFDGDESFITTGSIQAAGPVYGDSLAYSGDTTLPLSVTGANVTVGEIGPISGNWYAQTDTAAYSFIQFAVTPDFGATFTSDYISLYIGGESSPNLHAALYYSTQPGFASGTLLIDDTPLLEDSVAHWQANVNKEIGFGDTLYFRIYTYNTASESGPPFIALHNVSIYGMSLGITADPPTLTTAELTYISTTFATCGGNISTDGGNAVTKRGMVWNTTGEATPSDDHTLDGEGSGSFISHITGLTPGTTYYARAYAINGAGTSYGEERILQTLDSIVVPSVTTSAPDNILAVSAEGGGEVDDWGGDTVTARGVCWNIAGSPTVDDSLTIDGAGLGSYSSFIYPLEENTTYHIRAWATNSAGTGYGNERTFTTQVPSPDVIKVVATDGSGDYTSVQAAFDDVPDSYTGKYTILVKAGTYYEKLFLDRYKINVILKGVHADSSILVYNDNALSPNGSGGTVGTSGSYSVGIDADDFMAMDITFRNTNQEEQAVALRSNGDRQSYYRCKILGYQDTYYAWGGRGTQRNYFRNCLIEGSVDFIFGRNIVVFDSCVIRENRNGGELTAASTEPESKFGLVFIDCIIEAPAVGYNGSPITSFKLGRPWQKAPRTVFLNCYEPASLDPTGWDNWNVVPALYAEYNCYGPGSDYTNRNPISRQLTEEEAADYTVENIFARESNPLYSYDWMPVQDYYKLGQTITFPAIPEQDINTRSFEPEASASSHLPLSYTSSDTLVASVDGEEILLLSNGTTQITASQSGNFMYNAAEDVSQTLVVSGELSLETNDGQNVMIYPNPSSGLLTIDRNENEIQVLRIVSLDGQILREEILDSDHQQIDISSLPEGMYIIHLRDVTYKLIVK